MRRRYSISEFMDTDAWGNNLIRKHLDENKVE
jgi:hypothetical protein